MKVLRNGMVILVLLFLFTSCGTKQEETTLGKGESVEQTQNEQPRVTSEKQSLSVQVEDTEIRQLITKVIEEKDWQLGNQGIEEYSILSIHSGSIPETNARGGTLESNYCNYLNFCYEVNDKVCFQTVSTDLKVQYPNYKVSCSIGTEDKVTIFTGEDKWGTIKSIYYFTLTKETYQTIYNS